MNTPQDTSEPLAAAGLFADVLDFIEDQSRQFMECAKRQTDRDNRGAESVALRASEILDRIATDIRSANVHRELPPPTMPENTTASYGG